MKIYIASSFSISRSVEFIAAMLEKSGHTITTKWWEHKDLKSTIKEEEDDEVFYADPRAEEIYHRDRHGVQDADVLVFIADKEPRAYNGANIELGWADAWGKPCFSLGKLAKCALYSNTIRCENVGELLTAFSLRFGCGKLGVCQHEIIENCAKCVNTILSSTRKKSSG